MGVSCFGAVPDGASVDALARGVWYAFEELVAYRKSMRGLQK